MSSIVGWSDHTGAAELTADAVVIGTGAGGAVAAAMLAEGGQRVVMIEEGSLFRTTDFGPDTLLAMRRLYRDMGTNVILGPPHIAFAEGKCVGGSTTINGGMCWRPPERILHGWASELGMPELGPDSMAPYFDRVERRIGVASQLPESIGEDSQIMRRGADAMGYEWLANKRNQVACVGTNNCAFGCPTGAKQSTLLSYVPRALAAGATLLTECRADRVLIEGGRAVGITGRVVDPRTRKKTHRVTVRADAVVLSCGAVHTPLLLLGQRLANRSKTIGRNFLCHPNAKVVGVFPNDVKGWKGVSQGQQIRQFLDDGIMIAENFVPPSFIAISQPAIADPVYGALQRYNQMVTAACLIEDSQTGRIRRAPLGTPWLRYRFSQDDMKRALRGVAYLCRMFFAAGAERVLLPLARQHEIRSPADIDALENANIPVNELELFTVHMMGTAAMGTDPTRSVVDRWGQTHDVPGLWIADASVFPTAIGVNPQITIMALADRTAQRILETAVA